VNPLVYQQVGDSLAIFGSAAGGPRHPDWFYNLVAHPDAAVEVGTKSVKVRARVADPDERASIYARQKESPRTSPTTRRPPRHARFPS
jgi:deazaflavin-dependent oxidoreductase (nitroreductase family)